MAQESGHRREVSAWEVLQRMAEEEEKEDEALQRRLAELKRPSLEENPEEQSEEKRKKKSEEKRGEEKPEENKLEMESDKNPRSNNTWAFEWAL